MNTNLKENKLELESKIFEKCIKKSKGKQGKYVSISLSTQPIPLLTFFKSHEKNGIEYNEGYQRKYVWKENKSKSELIKNILFNLAIGYFTVKKKSQLKYEILDGQQRFKTILAFMGKKVEVDNFETEKVTWKIREPVKKFALSKTVSKQIFEENFNFFYDEYKNSNKKYKLNIFSNYAKGKEFRLKFEDLPTELQEKFNNYIILMQDVNVLQPDQIKEYFHSIQNQEMLKVAEIMSSLPQNEEIARHLSNTDLEKFANLINFDNNRNQVYKILVLTILIDQNKISLGTPDKEIMNTFKKKLDSLDEKQKTFLNTLKEETDNLFNIYGEKKKTNHKLKRFALKILFLSHFYAENEEYKNKNLIQKIEVIRKMDELRAKSISIDGKDDDFWKNNWETKQNIDELQKFTHTTHKKNEIKLFFQTSFEILFRNFETNADFKRKIEEFKKRMQTRKTARMNQKQV